jgi:hypothetical protein
MCTGPPTHADAVHKLHAGGSPGESTGTHREAARSTGSVLPLETEDMDQYFRAWARGRAPVSFARTPASISFGWQQARAYRVF